MLEHRHTISLNMFTIVLGFILLAFIGFDSATWFFLGRASQQANTKLPQLPAATDSDKQKVLDTLAATLPSNTASSSSSTTTPGKAKQLSTQDKLKMLDALAHLK